MLAEIELAMLEVKPDGVLVYGDTNSTLAGALAAAKLHIPVFHIESGLRSGNMRMPEEVNRILTDQVSDSLYCPTEAAVKNLRDENVAITRKSRIKLVGDVMQDASIMFNEFAVKPAAITKGKKFCLGTIHRAENTDDPVKLTSIFKALDRINDEKFEVILPLHPRTKSLIKQYGIDSKITFIEPVSYFEMLWLLDNCELVFTDSGGVQKEAYFFNKHCITIRDQTEWVELVDLGVNRLTSTNSEDIFQTFVELIDKEFITSKDLYGGGHASKIIVDDILDRLKVLHGG